MKEWGINIAKVDGTREKDLADEYGVIGWPTFKMFRKGRVYKYDGPREKDNIVTFMKQQFKSPSEEKLTRLGLVNNMDRLEATIVGFFKGSAAQHSDFFDEYIVAANEMRGTFQFLHTFSEEYSNQKSSATYKEIVSFIKKSSIPLVGQRTKKNLFKYAPRPLVVIYYDVNYDHQYVVEVAKEYKSSNLRFAISNEEEFADEIKGLGLEDSGEDVAIGCYSDKQKFKYKLDGDFESENLSNFIILLRSDGCLVKNLVANNYDDEIHKIKKDAVIFFHAPWCGHCKDLDPVFKKVAKKISANNENIIFGKMNGESNDIPYILFFVSAYEKFDPVLFRGDRNYKSIRDWVNRHSSIFLTEEERTGHEAIEDDEIENPAQGTRESNNKEEPEKTKDEL
ncbi:Protein disulfide-isomerase [Caligus rogercresseyi]|uniref:Protein disulfide-isomerase n=1 Tax=Caligus rogercresseyi TaxID=217165 RepID=A0A7T8GUV9_CALRO|nr:Protein disulfide-isomerase [Caligus rogercresseyi]